MPVRRCDDSGSEDRCSYAVSRFGRAFRWLISWLEAEEGSSGWIADKTGKGHSGEGKLLSGHAQQVGWVARGDRRIVRRPAECGSRLWGQAAPGAWGVSRRLGAGGGRPRGQHTA